MTASGASYTSVLQGNIEASFGAGGPATRMLTDVLSPAELLADYKTFRQASLRGDIHPQHNAPVISSKLESIKGIKLGSYFESVPWWLQMFVKGGITGAMTDTSAYTYTFSPSAQPANGNDRKSASFEIGDAVGYWTIAGAVGTKLGFKFYGNKPMEMTADFEAQKRTALTPLTTLSPVAWETINGSTFKAYCDDTTLGSTAFAATEASFDLENKYEWNYTGDGNLYPTEAILTGYTAKIGLKTVWKSATEWTNWLNSTERKIRLLVEGSLVGAITKKKSLQIDWYGFWDTPPEPKESNGLLFVDLTGECHLDSSATKTFEIAVTNGLVTLP
jgi:hypothetical protein